MVERGISWEGAMEIFSNHSKPNDGFYFLGVSSLSQEPFSGVMYFSVFRVRQYRLL